MSIAITIILSSALFLIVVQLCFVFFKGLFSPKSGELKEFPAVSILKPIKSISPQQEKEISSLFELEYPHYEILFALDENDQESAEIIRAIACRFSQKNYRILFAPVDYRLNPKIQKLQQLLEISSNDLLWVSDLNVAFNRDDLKKIIRFYLQKRPALIFFPVRGAGAQSFGSLIENCYLNLFLSGTTIAAWQLFRIPIIVGKSLFIEKEKISSFPGGFLYFQQYLAEDQMLGEIFRQRGFAVASNLLFVTNINRRSTLKAFADRIVRWNKLRFRISPHFYIAEPLLNPLIFSLFLLPFNLNVFSLLLLKIALFKVCAELIAYFLLARNDLNVKNLLRFAPAVLLKDLLVGLFYFFPFFSRTIIWHGNRFRIGYKSRIK